MNPPVIAPSRWLISYLSTRNLYYQSLGVGRVHIVGYPVGEWPAMRMPTIIVAPISVTTTPFGVPDLFEERYTYRLFGYILDVQPEQAHQRLWLFGMATLRLLAQIPHVITQSGTPFYTPEHWMPSVEFGQTMIGQTPVHGWSAEVIFHHTASYAPLTVDDQLAYPPESFER